MRLILFSILPWLSWRLAFFNLRTHRKLLIVDGVTGFAGGAELGEGLWKGRLVGLGAQRALDANLALMHVGARLEELACACRQQQREGGDEQY